MQKLSRISIIAVGIAFMAVLAITRQAADNFPAAPSPIPPQFRDASLFLGAINNSTIQPHAERISGITVPHHLLAIDLIADLFIRASQNHYSRVIVIAPDHFFLGKTPISVASRDLSTSFGVLKTDSKLVEQLLKIPSISSADFFYREHGIQAELPFIKHFFPDIPVVAITIKEGTHRDSVDQLVEALARTIDDQTLIVQSTDFSHYLPSGEADKKDAETIQALTSGNPGRIYSLSEPAHLDSIAAQYVQTRLQSEFFKSRIRIVARKNSQDYTETPLQKTTSYITQIYSPD